MSLDVQNDFLTNVTTKRAKATIHQVAGKPTVGRMEQLKIWKLK